jgi:hypothetical protein
MKTKTTFGLIVMASLTAVILFAARQLCRSQADGHVAYPDERTGTQRPTDALPENGPVFSRLYDEVSYHVLRQVPEDIRRRRPDAYMMADDTWRLVTTMPAAVYTFAPDGAFVRKVDFGEPDNDYVDVLRHAADDTYWLGDPANRRVRVYDADGRHLRDVQLSFRFMHVALSPSGDRLAFYMAMGDEPGEPRDAVAITDLSGKVLRTLFPIAQDQFFDPTLVDERFYRGEDAVYYNPVYSGEIYRIDFDGRSERIADLDLCDTDCLKAIDSLRLMPSTPGQLRAIRNLLPVESFLVHPDYLIVGNVPHLINNDLLIQRSTGRGCLARNAILNNNFGPTFQFASKRPDGIDGAWFVSVYNARAFSMITGQIEDRNALKGLPDMLAPDELLVMRYKPDPAVWFPDHAPGREENQAGILLMPNPARESCTIRLSGMAGEGDLVIIGVGGQVLFTQRVRVGDGDAESLTVDTGRWPPGSYGVKWLVGDQVRTATMLVL